jgi:hypothetical protein
MSIKQCLSRFDPLTFVDRFLIATFLVASSNFFEIFVVAVKTATDAAKSDVCYFGPPVPFYPRFWVAFSLLVASLASFGRSLGSRGLSVIGVALSSLVYIGWWRYSYRLFGNFPDSVELLKYFRANQTLYLYHGTWTDIAVALSIAVCFVLRVERLMEHETITLNK